MNTKLYVAMREDGTFLAIDSHSGGYPWFPENVGSAERFQADQRAVDYIASCNKEGPFTIHEIILGPGMSFNQFKAIAREDIRAQALAKLTVAEREALGV